MKKKDAQTLKEEKKAEEKKEEPKAESKAEPKEEKKPEAAPAQPAQSVKVEASDLMEEDHIFAEAKNYKQVGEFSETELSEEEMENVRRLGNYHPKMCIYKEEKFTFSEWVHYRTTLQKKK